MTTSRRAIQVSVTAATVAALALATGPAVAATSTGPSTTVAPYVLPVAAGVDITSLFTVGDSKAADNGYEMVGIPDGLGSYLDEDGNRVVLMNHELKKDAGIVRAHGQKGAFVSKLTLDGTGKVLTGEDLIDDVTYFDYATKAYGGTPESDLAAFNRFCSSALTEPGQLLVGPGRDGNGLGQGRGNGKYGFAGQIFFANEEAGVDGRAFGVTLDGHATQLPALGKFSWENTLAAPNETRTTVVMGNDDGDTDASHLRIYGGTKTRMGSPVERAGLTNGVLSVLQVAKATTDTDFRKTYAKGEAVPFSLATINAYQSGALQKAEATALKGLGFTRIEDGSFNPDNKNEYFFLTTQGGDTKLATTGSRDGGGLWKLTFNDVERPELGGTLELVLDGTEEWGTGESRANKPDNMTIDGAGNMLIQEDPGNNAHLARILSYRIDDGARGVLARFDPARFSASTSGTAPAPGFLTTDEESSGIIEIAKGEFLFDAQVHTNKDLPVGTGRGTVEEFVEGGQLLRMSVASFSSVYTVTP